MANASPDTSLDDLLILIFTLINNSTKKVVMDKINSFPLQYRIKLFKHWSSKCMCCERHQRSRPTTLYGVNMPWKIKSIVDINNPLNRDCKCRCRLFSRKLFEKLYNVEI